MKSASLLLASLKLARNWGTSNHTQSACDQVEKIDALNTEFEPLLKQSFQQTAIDLQRFAEMPASNHLGLCQILPMSDTARRFL